MDPKLSVTGPYGVGDRQFDHRYTLIGPGRRVEGLTVDRMECYN